MTRQQAEATGLVTGVDPAADKGCSTTKLRASTVGSESTVFFDGASGVVAIDVRGTSVRTPEGVHVGSSGAGMRKACPDWTPASDPNPDNARGVALAPGSNGKAEYNISVVNFLELQVRPHHCYE
ncbi:hypothetical protein [Dactylosporangium sp. CA-139066]|uniref:hypothetical protein n=1 Tax=Dactylosporangium sp. CA-139066 TaxID=3239930 RepID=UPI003D900871